MKINEAQTKVYATETNNRMKYRYPGINSFDTEDEDIFFGRENDRKQLAEAVEIEKSMLLYARSGMGKSSLLKAALIPELLKKGYQSYYIRLGAYQATEEQQSLPPLQTLLRKTVLAKQKQLPQTFLHKFLNRSYSLWYAFKTMQIKNLETTEKEQPIVLIFDQFEEVFSYPAKQIADFKQQLAELLYTAIPKNYLEALKENSNSVANDELLTEKLTENEIDLLYKALKIKVVFSIRSDQMSLLNELTDYLPNLLKVFYELKPLTEKQALEAITAPAQEKGDFATPKFVYREEAKTKILKALSSQKQKGIDTAQLQIVLQYIEKDIVEAKKDYDLTADDLGDLNKVYENYYHNSLAKLPNVTEKEKARRLIEDKLIVEGRRISYDEQLCLQQVSTTTLTTLVETRLLRREPNSTDGFSYELSHDTLVKPVLDAKEQYEAEQALIRQAQQKEAERVAAIQKAEEERIEKAKLKKQFQILAVAFGLALVAVFVAGWFYFDAQKQKEQAQQAQAAATEALQSFWAAEIERNQGVIKLLEADKETYVKSEEKSLEQQTKQQIDSIQKVIEKYQKQLK
jgi:hypothetical protein